MNIVVTLLLVAALLVAGAWGILLAMAGAVEVPLPAAAPHSEEGVDEEVHSLAARQRTAT